MRRALRLSTMAILVGIGGFGCGDPPPPDVQRRAPTAQGAPPAEAPDAGSPSGPAAMDPGPPPDGFVTDCCMVNFAIADTTADEESVVLRGGQFPLNEAAGVALTHSTGAWRGTACIPITYNDLYWYDATVADDEGNSYSQTRANPFAPSGSNVNLGAVNSFVPVTDCSDASLLAHGKTM